MAHPGPVRKLRKPSGLDQTQKDAVTPSEPVLISEETHQDWHIQLYRVGVNAKGGSNYLLVNTLTSESVGLTEGAVASDYSAAMMRSAQVEPRHSLFPSLDTRVDRVIEVVDLSRCDKDKFGVDITRLKMVDGFQILKFLNGAVIVKGKAPLMPLIVDLFRSVYRNIPLQTVGSVAEAQAVAKRLLASE